MRDLRHDFWRNLRNELVAGRQWLDRAVVLAYAVLTGLTVVGFTLLSEMASSGFEQLQRLGAYGAWLPLLWTPALAVALLWWTQRFAPGAQGSGIPQVIAALDDQLPRQDQSRLVSLRLSLQKTALVSGGLLAGVVFALEQLSRRRSLSHSGLVIISIVLSGLVAVSVFGNLSYFGELRVQQLSWSLFAPGLLIAVATGFAGGLFSRLIVVSTRGMPDRFSRWRAQHPLRFAAGCGLAVAVIGIVTGSATAGAGYAPTRALLEGHGELPALYTPLKFCATWLSAWTGLPAGVFAPSLAIGAGIGNDVALLAGVGRDAAIPLIALGMVGFLAATTQGPLTAFIIVMEMVAGHAMVLSLMAVSLLASGVARWLTPPMYLELAAMLAPPGPSSASAGTTGVK